VLPQGHAHGPVNAFNSPLQVRFSDEVAPEQRVTAQLLAKAASAAAGDQGPPRPLPRIRDRPAPAPTSLPIQSSSSVDMADHAPATTVTRLERGRSLDQGASPRLYAQQHHQQQQQQQRQGPGSGRSRQNSAALPPPEEVVAAAADGGEAGQPGSLAEAARLFHKVRPADSPPLAPCVHASSLTC
jgi:hypothetical protein